MSMYKTSSDHVFRFFCFALAGPVILEVVRISFKDVNEALWAYMVLLSVCVVAFATDLKQSVVNPYAGKSALILSVILTAVAVAMSVKTQVISLPVMVSALLVASIYVFFCIGYFRVEYDEQAKVKLKEAFKKIRVPFIILLFGGTFSVVAVGYLFKKETINIFLKHSMIAENRDHYAIMASASQELNKLVLVEQVILLSMIFVLIGAFCYFYSKACVIKYK